LPSEDAALLNEHSFLAKIDAIFRQNADQIAVIQYLAGKELRISFSELWRKAESMQPILQKHCVNDDFILIYAKRSIDSLALVVACQMCGKPFSILNNKLQIPQVETAILQCNSNALWIDDTTVPMLKKGVQSSAALRGTKLLAMRDEHWGTFQEKQFAALQQHTEALVVEPGDFEETPIHVGYETSGEAAAACLFTSGSTGKPKGVLISSGDLSSRTAAEISCFGLLPGQRILNILPWSFDVGLSQVLCTLAGGCTLVIIDSWLPADIVSHAGRLQVDGISSVPSMWLDLLASGLQFEEPAPRYVTVSGGSLPAQQLAELAALLPNSEIIRTYGQTETCRTAIGFKTDADDQPTSVGRVYPGCHAYIVNERLERVPFGVEGELLHSGDGVMLGYLDGNDQAKRIPNPFKGQNGDNAMFAIRTGDRASQDADGRIYLHGRADDLVKIKGNRVFLSEVLAEVMTLSTIADAQIVTRERNGVTEIVLFVAPKDTEEPIAARTLLKSLSSRLPNYMLPTAIEILQRLPRTSNGKPDRQRLLGMLGD
jgi:acyl-coenzyme A synthetase/AMP-(fatty) acid ligase